MRLLSCYLINAWYSVLYAKMLLGREFLYLYLLIYLFFTVGFPAIRVSVTPRISPDIFSAIIDLSVSHGKKGKKKGKVIIIMSYKST